MLRRKLNTGDFSQNVVVTVVVLLVGHHSAMHYKPVNLDSVVVRRAHVPDSWRLTSPNRKKKN